mgnify:CR=1 FL=1
MPTITLYAYNFISRAERVLWALNELEIEHNIIRLDPFAGETMTDTFGDLNPQRKIPVLTHGDKVLTDSLAIMEYLCSLKPEKKLIPTDADKLYQFREIIYFTLTEVESYLWIADQATRLSFLYNWPEGTEKEAINRVENALLHINETLADKPFILGDEFSLADIYIGHILLWIKRTGLDLSPKTFAYMKKLSQRSAFPDIINQQAQQ